MPREATRSNPPWPGFFLVTALIPGHLFDWAVEWAFASCTTVLGILAFHRFQARAPLPAQFGLLTVLFASYVSLIGFVGTLAIASLPTGLRDVVDLLKPCMVFFSCSLAFAEGAPSLQSIRRGCFIVMCFAVITGIVLMLEVPVLGALMDSVYGSTKTGFSEFRVRLSIPFENPNFLGLLSVLSLFIALNFSEKTDVKLALVSLVAAGLSGSRTAWATALLVLLVFLLRMAGSVLTLRLPLRRVIPAVALAVLTATAAARFESDMVESYQRLANFVDLIESMDLSADESYAERIALRDNASDLISQRPFTGWGALKYSNLAIVDSQYYGLLLRFGVLGVVVLSLYVLGLLALTLKSLGGAGYRAQAMVMWLVLAVWLWNGSFMENIRMAILIVLIFTSIIRPDERTAH